MGGTGPAKAGSRTTGTGMPRLVPCKVSLQGSKSVIRPKMVLREYYFFTTRATFLHKRVLRDDTKHYENLT